MSHWLDGIVVADFSQALAGPYLSMGLASMGARVIKVEPPEGDQSRQWAMMPDGHSAYFLAVNRRKESVALNLKAPGAADFVHRLFAAVDVVIENYRPGVFARLLNTTYEELMQRYPRLILASISAYGRTDPARRPGYDVIIQGETGLMALNGGDAHPVKTGTSVEDVFTGSVALPAILAALYRRERTGRGDSLDIAMLDCGVWLLAETYGQALISGEHVVSSGNHHPSITPFGVFQAQDRPVTIGVGSAKLWEALLHVEGFEPLRGRPEYRDNGSRTAHRAALIADMEGILAVRPAAEWVALLKEGGVPAGLVNTPEEVVERIPQGFVRNLRRYGSPTVPEYTGIAFPAPSMTSSEDATVKSAAPELGEHSRPVAAELGYAEADIEALEVAGALIVRPATTASGSLEDRHFAFHGTA